MTIVILVSYTDLGFVHSVPLGGEGDWGKRSESLGSIFDGGFRLSLLKFQRALSWCSLAVATMAFSFFAFSQGTATIRGTVYDASHAAIPGASVVAINVETNFTRRTVTSAEGIYFISTLGAGNYRVSVESQGFKQWSGTLVLQTGQTAVVNATLELGSVDTVVEVTGAAPIINSESAEVGDVKDAQRIRQLPLN